MQTEALPASITLPSGSFPVKWRRSARSRRLSVRIDPRERQILVTLPVSVSSESGRSFLQRQTGWLDRQLCRTAQGIRFSDGEKIPVGNRHYTIRHMPDRRGGAWTEGDILFISGQEDFLARRVRDFLIRLATKTLTARTLELAGTTNLHPTKLAIRDTSSRWGSCSTSGRIMLSWRLLMAPDFVRDYVILHELAHLRHMNHGPGFRGLLDALTPCRAEAEKWLKQHGSALMRAG